MSFRWWISDTHVNHPNILKYCGRPMLKSGDLDSAGRWISSEIAFQRAEEMNAILIRNANSRVKAEDTVVCVGDFACQGGEKGTAGLHVKTADLLARLNGTWVLMEGNHDKTNGVKPVCNFMSCRIANYRVGVQHIPLYDEDLLNAAHDKWLLLSDEEKELDPWRDRLDEEQKARAKVHAEYCRQSFDFMLCGHIHTAWHVMKIAGLWHVNVGVDANRFMPINDSEVLGLFQQAKRSTTTK